ncbi:prepilin-type N-terminal cleavage/methylation domain-containing protein [Pseudidiomarina mangrovi]|uniref:prepilin-type N-terminal cleavage/methylation domain-containing protein n=1 Tax=Pseudidiomarina mangrovi TaxID=2487133 RepID=UPI000FC9FC33|nr:prepilin-type N-terminal cleavage/methylation domain-containing protein [Pseudidiomarina mangrovi]
MTRSKINGLTIIELVVVIVIIGILAVTAGPVFFGRQGVDEYLFQARLYSVLRLQQQKAMQDTGNCYGVIVQSNRFAATDDCNTSIIADPLANRGLGISQGEASDAGLVISSTAASVPYTIKFNALGCPVTIPDSCDDGVNHQLSIVGTTTLLVCVNSQGYMSKGPCL